MRPGGGRGGAADAAGPRPLWGDRAALTPRWGGGLRASIVARRPCGGGWRGRATATADATGRMSGVEAVGTVAAAELRSSGAGAVAWRQRQPQILLFFLPSVQIVRPFCIVRLTKKRLTWTSSPATNATALRY
uniref:Uncharacterized protein n=1 Tax=Arundo donax TaxID=35708 RepID=A0A0A9A3G9_ARUDO